MLLNPVIGNKQNNFALILKQLMGWLFARGVGV